MRVGEVDKCQFSTWGTSPILYIALLVIDRECAVVLLRGTNEGHGEYLVDIWCCERASRLWPLEKDCSYTDRTMRTMTILIPLEHGELTCHS